MSWITFGYGYQKTGYFIHSFVIEISRFIPTLYPVIVIYNYVMFSIFIQMVKILQMMWKMRWMRMWSLTALIMLWGTCPGVALCLVGVGTWKCLWVNPALLVLALAFKKAETELDRLPIYAFIQSGNNAPDWWE